MVQEIYFLSLGVTQFPDKQVRDIALKVLRHNAFFAHPEHVILRCLAMKTNRSEILLLIRLCLYVKHSLLATLTTLRNKLRGSKSCEEVHGFIHKQKCNFVSPAS